MGRRPPAVWREEVGREEPASWEEAGSEGCLEEATSWVGWEGWWEAGWRSQGRTPPGLPHSARCATRKLALYRTC